MAARGKQDLSGELWRELAGQAAPRYRGTQCFVSWQHVDAGVVPWTQEGRPVSCWDSPPAQTQGPTGPVGIRLEAQKAQMIGPLMEMDRPWETNYNMYFASVLFQDGWFRAWYTCVPEDDRDPETNKRRVAHGHVVCYAQSRDGLHWEKPNLGLYTYQGMDTNIVYGRELAPYGFQSGSVFLDPHAPPSERYKLFFLGVLEYEDDLEQVQESFARRFGRGVDPKVFSLQGGRVTAKCMCAAVSPDGLHWTTYPLPVLALPSDTLNTCFWEEERGTYVAYLRLWRNGRRLVGRAESPDFFLWRENAVPVLEADLSWPGYMDIYTNSRTGYPGSDQRLMFPAVYDRSTDRREIYLAVSEDERSWRWVPGGPVAQCADAGRWDSGDLNPGTGMVFLDRERVALPVMVSSEPHKYPRKSGSSLGKPGWLVWKRGRLGCIVADQFGRFTTNPMVCCGEELSLNLDVAARVGKVLVELQDASGVPIPGYTLEQVDPLCLGGLDCRASWGGKRSLTALQGEPIRLHFELRAAKIYSFEWTAGPLEKTK